MHYKLREFKHNIYILVHKSSGVMVNDLNSCINFQSRLIVDRLIEVYNH